MYLGLLDWQIDKFPYKMTQDVKYTGGWNWIMALAYFIDSVKNSDYNALCTVIIVIIRKSRMELFEKTVNGWTL